MPNPMKTLLPLAAGPVSYTHLRAHETLRHRVCRLLLEKIFFLMIRRPPRSTPKPSSAASDVYKRQDIYCGIGSISLFLAQKATKVYGIEIVEDAIKDAKINAKLNNLNNVEFYVGKAEEVVPKMYSEGKTANVVVVDPPRKGCDEKVLDTIVSMKPDRVVYVSCNPSTLARDLAYLDERGYKCVEIQPVDMFPHTMHVECCAKIVKKSDL